MLSYNFNMMKPIKALLPKQLCPRCDPEQFTFNTTADLKEFKEIIGQKRALESVRFGVGIKQKGYNLYALGPPGIGKQTLIHKILDQESKRLPAATDWCYIFNFKSPQKPLVLQLPQGLGSKLRKDMQLLIEDLSTEIPAIFETDEYLARMQEIDESIKSKQDTMLLQLQEEAEKDDMAILSTPHGFTVVPARKGKVLSADEFEKLSKDEQEAQESKMIELREKLTRLLEQIPLLQKERREKKKEAQ